MSQISDGLQLPVLSDGNREVRREPMILAKEIHDRINALRSNNVAGASALAEEAGAILVRVVDLGSRGRPQELRSRVLAAGKAIIKAQPAMAPMYTLVNDVLLGLGQSDQDRDLGKSIKERTRLYLSRLHEAANAAARRASALITDGSVIVTHSRSSLVERALLEGAKSGREFSVVCTESRPMMEGRALAEHLSEAGIPTTLVIDAAAGALMRAGARVFVGADALSVHGLINKIGTRMIAMAARAAGVPFTVLATTQRFLPPSVPLSYQELKNPQELLDSQSSLKAVNLYYDHTPLDDLTDCVTESALLDRQALVSELKAWQVQEILDLEACG